MPWSTSIHPDLPLIEISYSGVITATELSDAFLDTLALANAHNITLILADCTALDSGGHSVFDLYFLAETLAASNMPKTLKEAILLPSLPDSAENVDFWETACYNRGLKVRIFDNYQNAIDWLMDT